MSRHTTKLTAFIKPSSPTEATQEKVKQNTQQWMQTNMQILEEHYDGVIATILQDLPPYEPQALQKAIAYGRIRYRHKLTPSSIETLTGLTQSTPRAEMQRQSTLEFEEHLADWPGLGPPTYPPEDVRFCLASSGLPSGLPQRIPHTRLHRGPAQTMAPNLNHSSSTPNLNYSITTPKLNHSSSTPNPSFSGSRTRPITSQCFSSVSLPCLQLSP